MPGFTPINAHAIAKTAPTTNDDASNNGETTSVEQKATKRPQPARKKNATSKTASRVASNDVHEDITQKRISGKGRKRTNTPDDEPQSKRRRSGNVKSSMSTTKPGVGATATAAVKGTKMLGDSSTESQAVSISSKSKLDGFRYNSSSAENASVGASHSVGSMSAFTPQVLMNSLQTSQAQTTMQAVKSSAGGSSLLYSSSAVPSSVNAGIEIARPLLSSTQSHGNEPIGSSRSPVSRPQLPTPAGSDSPTVPVEHKPRRSQRLALRSASEDFGDPIDEDGDDIIELTKRIEKSAAYDSSPSARPRKLNIRDTHAHDDYGGALLTEEERRILDAIKLPQDSRKPVVRTIFPTPIMDRSSLFGVSNSNALRTCFRVGEALNAGCQAVRNNRNLILELYARITSSWREPQPSRKQHFIINDLYHDKPPSINGTFELWGQSRLWNQDSSPFVNAGADGMICRLIGRMKRDGPKWKLEILSIWQADWEDVEHVAGIYAKPVIGDDLEGFVK